MAYGDPIATISTHGDNLFCLKCAAYVYTHMGDRTGNDFFFWVRDLPLAKIQMDREDIAEFAKNAERHDPDYSICVLREGQDQTWINEEYCQKCATVLVELCKDYP